MPASVCSQRMGRRHRKKWSKRDYLLCHPKLESLCLSLKSCAFFLPSHEDTVFHLLSQIPQFNITWLYLSDHIPALEAFTAPKVLVLNSTLQTSYNCNYLTLVQLSKYKLLIIWTVQPRMGCWRLVNLPFTLLHTIGFVLVLLWTWGNWCLKNLHSPVIQHDYTAANA